MYSHAFSKNVIKKYSEKQKKLGIFKKITGTERV